MSCFDIEKSLIKYKYGIFYLFISNSLVSSFIEKDELFWLSVGGNLSFLCIIH